MNDTMHKEHEKVVKEYEADIAEVDLELERAQNIVALFIPMKEMLELQIHSMRRALAKNGCEIPTVAKASKKELADLEDKLVKVASGATMIEKRRAMLKQQKEERIRMAKDRNRLKKRMSRIGR